jgi:hypothetical protein
MFQPDLDEIRFALAEKSLADFTRIGWRYIDPADYIGNWHIDAMSEHLEAVANGRDPQAHHQYPAAAHEA